MFKIGDVVEITAEAATFGLLDFKKGKGYKVEAPTHEQALVRGRYETTHSWIFLTDESGRTGKYAASHFKLKKDTIVEKKECLFKEGQVVWDLRNGRGVVEEIINDELYPVRVRFDLKDMDGGEIIDYYMADGRYAKTQTVRSLYFSEPKIEAATEPLFEPTLKEGDVLFAYGKHEDVAGDMGRIIVLSETERAVFDENDVGWLKTHWEFYKLGEKINFK